VLASALTESVRWRTPFEGYPRDRPFGFLAVHRPSRLAVVAGWVKSPFQPA